MVILVRIYGLAGKVKAKTVEGPTPVLEAKGGKLSISNREGSPWPCFMIASIYVHAYRFINT